MTLAEIVERLQGVKRERGGYVARCPSHDDRTPSLAVAEGDNGGVVMKCRAGCQTDVVLRALGLTMRDLAPPGVSTDKSTGEVVYPYTDEHGHLLFEAVRWIDSSGKKRFRQQRPDGSGGTVNNLEGVQRVLYRLPELIEGIALGKRVHICEGEKDCDRLASLGLVATTNPMGAGKWRPEFGTYLEGATDVVVLADNDDPGRAHVHEVAAAIPGARIIHFPEL